MMANLQIGISWKVYRYTNLKNKYTGDGSNIKLLRFIMFHEVGQLMDSDVLPLVVVIFVWL
jgi:hypothetical protein